MISNTVTLVVDIFLLNICILQIAANSIVLLAWITHKRLRSNDNLILLVSLAFIDFVYAVLQFPYLVYLLSGWQPNGQNFAYNENIMIWLGGPSAALMKSGCTITTFIALDRALATFLPLKYYNFPKRMLCTGAFFFAILMAFIDWLVLYFTVKIKSVPGCASFGCFTTTEFRAYWGLSNMMVNLLSTTITGTLMIVRCCRHPGQTDTIEKMHRAKIDKSANRVSMYILLVSALIGVVPGCLNGVGTLVQIPILDEISFFVGTSATLSGLSHAFIFAMAHRDIKRSIFRMFGCVPLDGRIAQMQSRVDRSVVSTMSAVPATITT